MVLGTDGGGRLVLDGRDGFREGVELDFRDLRAAAFAFKDDFLGGRGGAGGSRLTHNLLSA